MCAQAVCGESWRPIDAVRVAAGTYLHKCGTKAQGLVRTASRTTVCLRLISLSLACIKC